MDFTNLQNLQVDATACQCMQVHANECKRMQVEKVHESEWKWLQLNATECLYMVFYLLWINATFDIPTRIWLSTVGSAIHKA